MTRTPPSRSKGQRSRLPGRFGWLFKSLHNIWTTPYSTLPPRASGCLSTLGRGHSVAASRLQLVNEDCKISFAVYEVERLLYHIKPSSPGLDNIPRWFYHNCSYEIPRVVAHILNLSFSCGTVPMQWRQAVVLVTPVPCLGNPKMG